MDQGFDPYSQKVSQTNPLLCATEYQYDPQHLRLPVLNPFDNFLKAPITRLQRYPLLIDTILKKMVGNSQEKTDLEIALREIRAVVSECNTRVAEMQRKLELVDLGSKLVLRPSMQHLVEHSRPLRPRCNNRTYFVRERIT